MIIVPFSSKNQSPILFSRENCNIYCISGKTTGNFFWKMHYRLVVGTTDPMSYLSMGSPNVLNTKVMVQIPFIVGFLIMILLIFMPS